MMHSYGWHDAFICGPWRFHICYMVHRHDLFTPAILSWFESYVQKLEKI